jgi:ERCC4-related helicase
VNKAYKSTNIDADQTDLLKDKLPSLRSVKMTKNELEDTLVLFRCGKVNVLIATNVVEEGLDVSTCNQVICLNELMTVKAFIQMKGRARQSDSRFIFLAAKEQCEKV